MPSISTGTASDADASAIVVSSRAHLAAITSVIVVGATMFSLTPRRLLRAAPRFRRALSTRPPLEGDAYAILGAERGSSAKDLKKAYHRLARSWHPDVSSQPDAAFVFPHISRSYEILSDAQQRHLYDFILAKRLLPLATPDRFQAFYALSLIHI